MGMFDYIICEHDLPDGFNPSGIKFQTKDLYKSLDTFTISADGRLIHHYVEFEETPDEELPYPDMPYIGCLRVKKGSEKLIDVNYHGFIRFYNSNICAGGPNYFCTSKDESPWSRRYTAKFTDGKIANITLESDEITEHGKHIKRSELKYYMDKTP